MIVERYVWLWPDADLKTVLVAGSSNSTKTNIVAAVLILLVALSYGAVAFYPYQLTWPEYARNGAKRHEDGSLSFPTPGLAVQRSDGRSARELKPAESFRVLLDVRSFAPNQTGPARIASFSWNAVLRNLTIGQEGSDLVVRVRRLHADRNGQPDLVVAGVFATPGWHKIETHVDSESVEVKVDGGTSLVKPNSPESMASWDSSYPWVFGNERTGGRPWRGKIRTAQVCVDGKYVDVLRSDKLVVPDRYWARAWSALVHPGELIASTPMDMAVNLFGFVPLGALLAWLRRPVVGVRSVVITAAAFSVSLEVGQILFAKRYTSLVDVVCNVIGAVIGYLAARRMAGMRSERRSGSNGPTMIRSGAGR